MNAPRSIMISRTDSIGDVVLTLPMAGVLKTKWPETKIIFLGRTYTRDVVALSGHVDEFVNYDELKSLAEEEKVNWFKQTGAEVILHVFPRKEIALLAEKAAIPLRVGTMSRLYHWYTCNRKIHLPRKNSKLHEAQLNLKMLRALGVEVNPLLSEIPDYYGFENLPELSKPFRALLSHEKYNLILHPRSKGSAREWGLENFSELLKALPEDQFRLFVSGTKQEGESMAEWIKAHPRLTNLTGQMSLTEFIAFIGAADGLVAASTGPLHLAAALGKQAIGLFAPMRPIHPGRWKPLGPKAEFLVVDRKCNECKTSGNCHCIREIRAQQVVDLLSSR